MIGFFVHKGVTSVVISDRMSFVTLRGRWYDVVLNLHALPEDKNDTM